MSRLRKHFGTAGLLVAVVALVAAVGGSAVAANSGDNATASAKKRNKKKKKQSGLNGKQKRQVIAIAKRFQGTGPAGPQGLPGLPGAPGSDGDDGSDGDNGQNGKEGKEGKEGKAGESVEVNAYTGPECEEASGESGAEFTNGTGTAYACNGLDGGGGSSVQTGVWSASEVSPIGAGFVFEGYEEILPIGFTSPVSPAPTFTYVPGPENGEPFGSAAGCPGVTGGLPEAEPGNLCVYGTDLEVQAGAYSPSPEVTTSDPSDPAGGPGVGPAGTTLVITCQSNATEACIPKGLWAVAG